MVISIPNGNAANEADVLTLESILGYQLSVQFKTFLRTHDGAEPESNIFDVGTANNSSINRFIPVSQIARERTVIGNLPSGAYPIAFDGSGNWVVIDESKQGAVFFWDHESDGEQTRLAASFDEFLALIRLFDPATVELKSEQIISVWIDPEFRATLKGGA